jgi:hypothetical protein
MKKIGILGTGMVGAALGKKLIELGYEVKMGSRLKGNPKALAWVSEHKQGATEGTFADAAAFGDIIFVCINGEAALAAIQAGGLPNYKGKTVIDVTNGLDFSHGMPPGLFITGANSIGEEVQKLLTDAYVVKALNTVNCAVMVDPKKSGGEITMFICGNNHKAKEQVEEILWQFGWSDILDLGDIKAARSMEALVTAWMNIMTTLKTDNFGFKIVRN